MDGTLPGNCSLQAYYEYISDYAADNASVMLLAAENSLFSKFAGHTLSEKLYKTKHENTSLITRAAGFAAAGYKAFVICDFARILSYGYGEIRDILAVPSLSVHLVVSFGGLSEGKEGVSYNVLDDAALLRSLPGMQIYVASDTLTVPRIVKMSESLKGTSYTRLSGTAVPCFPDEADDVLNPKGARILKSGTGVTVCACGIMVKEALAAASILEQQGISAEVIDCYNIKPLPEETLLSSVRRTGCCVVAEEHSAIGGLCSAVAECLSQTYPVPVRFAAVDDKFVDSGSPDELREYYGLTWKEIVNAAAQVWALRRR